MLMPEGKAVKGAANWQVCKSGFTQGEFHED
jgi:hypothetical protein